MATKFNGFTQDEINKITKPDKPKKVQMMSRGIRRVPDRKTAQGDILGRDVNDKLSSVQKDAPNKTLPKLSEPADNSLDSTITSMQEVLHFKPLPAKNAQKAMHEPPAEDESILHISSGNESQPGMEASSPFRGISLKDFQAQQKLIQEQNKQKKELLHKAIEHHSQKTAAEIQKIHTIKAELEKLDSDLAADVAILRKKIEDATIQYSNVRKAYERVESQFLKAKLELHQAGEKKELLTEHLCTVIAHNEDRKAKKLTELMEKVGLSPIGDLDLPANGNAID